MAAPRQHRWTVEDCTQVRIEPLMKKHGDGRSSGTLPSGHPFDIVSLWHGPLTLVVYARDPAPVHDAAIDLTKQLLPVSTNTSPRIQIGAWPLVRKRHGGWGGVERWYAFGRDRKCYRFLLIAPDGITMGGRGEIDAIWHSQQVSQKTARLLRRAKTLTEMTRLTIRLENVRGKPDWVPKKRKWAKWPTYRAQRQRLETGMTKVEQVRRRNKADADALNEVEALFRNPY